MRAVGTRARARTRTRHVFVAGWRDTLYPNNNPNNPNKTPLQRLERHAAAYFIYHGDVIIMGEHGVFKSMISEGEVQPFHNHHPTPPVRAPFFTFSLADP